MKRAHKIIFILALVLMLNGTAVYAQVTVAKSIQRFESALDHSSDNHERKQAFDALLDLAENTMKATDRRKALEVIFTHTPNAKLHEKAFDILIKMLKGPRISGKYYTASIELIQQLATQPTPYPIDFSKFFNKALKLPTDTAITLVQTFGSKMDQNMALAILATSTVHEDTNPAVQEAALSLSKKLIDAGAEVNSTVCGNSLMSLLPNNSMRSLLENRNGQCYLRKLQEVKSAGLTELLDNPKLIFTKKFKNLNAQPSIDNKIPYTIHHIWLTNDKQDPERRKLRAQDIAQAVKNKIALQKSDFNDKCIAWKHILWVNDIELIGNCDELASQGFEIRNIHDARFNLEHIDIIDAQINQSNWGMASNFLRYLIIKEHGGVYSDINFQFNPNHNLGHEVHTYNFFSINRPSALGLAITGFFFAASPHHPVVEEMVSLVYQNLTQPPQYIHDMVNKKDTCYVSVSSAMQTYMSYYLKANQGDNVDVIYPHISTEGAKDEHYFVNLGQSSEEIERDLNYENIPLGETVCNESPYPCADEIVHCKKVKASMKKYNRPAKPTSRFFIGSDGTNGGTWIR